MLATGRMPPCFCFPGSSHRVEIPALHLGSSGLSKERLDSPGCCSQACSHLRSCQDELAFTAFFLSPNPDLFCPLSSLCNFLTPPPEAPLRCCTLHVSCCCCLIPSVQHLGALDGQHAAVDLGLMIWALLPLTHCHGTLQQHDFWPSLAQGLKSTPSRPQRGLLGVVPLAP